MKTAAILGVFALLPVVLSAQAPDRTEDSQEELSGPMRLALAPDRKTEVLPIPLPKNEALLGKNLQARQTQWVEAQLLADFPKRNAAAPWLDDATAVLREAAPYLSGEIYKNEQTGKKITPPAALTEKGRAIIAAGCDDPLFNLIVPFLESSQSSRTQEQMTLAERRLPDLLDGGDSPHIKLFACGWIWGGRYDHAATKDPAKADAAAREIPKYLRQALDASATPEDSLGFYQFIHYNQGYILIYMKWKDVETAAMMKKSKAASWLADTLLGTWAIETAWKVRGSGHADTVSKEGWKGFEMNLAEAREHLVAAWKANPRVPFAAEKMITVTMAGSGDEGTDVREWFDRSIAACFDHIPAYHALIYAYQPRWGGSHSLMLAFGKACANTRRYDTDVPLQLYRVNSRISAELADRSVVYDDPEVRRLTVEIEKGGMPYARTDAEKHHSLSFGTCNAFLARDYALAAGYYKLLKEPILPEADNSLKSYGILPFEWRGWLAMQADRTVFAELLRAEGAYKKGDLASALSIYQRLATLPVTTSQEDAVALIRHRLAAIAVEQRFAKGEWVRLSDEEHKRLWITDTGMPWSAGDKGVISVRNEKNWVTSRVFLDARVGLDFELRASMDNPPDLPGSQFGCVLGYRPGHSGYATAVCGFTEAKPAKKGAALVAYCHDTTEKNPPIPAELKPNSKVRIRSLNGEVTLWVDENEIFTRNLDDCFEQRTPSEDAGKEQHRFGFGSRQFRKGESRLKEIEFRRITR
jgi:hypothetical protein